MLRKKLVQEQRENAQKKKSADQGSEPDNRITQNALPEETPIVASPPVYQDIYSRVPMLPMLPLPVFYNEDDNGSGEASMSPVGADFDGVGSKERLFSYPQAVDVEESSGDIASEENAFEKAERIAEENADQYGVPNEEESADLLDSEGERQPYLDDDNGSAANDMYEDAKNIEQGEGANKPFSEDNDASNRDETVAGSATAAISQGADGQAGMQDSERRAAEKQAEGKPAAETELVEKPAAETELVEKPAAETELVEKPAAETELVEKPAADTEFVGKPAARLEPAEQQKPQWTENQAAAEQGNW